MRAVRQGAVGHIAAQDTPIAPVGLRVDFVKTGIARADDLPVCTPQVLEMERYDLSGDRRARDGEEMGRSKGLAARGHPVGVEDASDTNFGHAHVIRVAADGDVDAACEPRSAMAMSSFFGSSTKSVASWRWWTPQRGDI